MIVGELSQTGLDEFTSSVDGPSVSFSSTFGPKTVDANRSPVDMILLSNDSVVFYADESTLLRNSKNSFDHLLPFNTKERSKRLLRLPEISSSELELMCRAIYNVSDTPKLPLNAEIPVIMDALDKLVIFGIDPRSCITPTSHLFQFLLLCTPIAPLEVYALAAYHGMEELAVVVSSHTLDLELSDISEDLARRIGAKYLMRLFRLHLMRVDTLRGLLAILPGMHTSTDTCGVEGQKVLKHKWTLGVASLLYEIGSGTPAAAIRDSPGWSTQHNST
ncbi:hypothetical protein V5O48_007737 [Marasmius crinis-equi]|uniref:BTB domain-containing protein n=1 Tax=Marasmius crinis-equi TaxID=585013 RepID=A0ABR3FFV0_9AGAR